MYVLDFLCLIVYRTLEMNPPQANFHAMVFLVFSNIFDINR